MTTHPRPALRARWGNDDWLVELAVVGARTSTRFVVDIPTRGTLTLLLMPVRIPRDL